MNGYTIFALVDTGAAISCINDRLYETLHLDQICDIISDTVYVQGVGGNQITKGKVRLPFVIAEREFVAYFTLIDRIAIDLIIGMDFLQNHNAKLNFTEHTLELEDLTVPFQHNQASEVVTPSNLVIPARTEVLIALKVLETPDGDPLLFEPRPSFSHIWQVIPAKTVTKVKNGRVNVQLMNPTTLDIELTSGAIVGNLVQISDIFPRPTHDKVRVHTLQVDKQEGNPVEELKDALDIDLSEADVTEQQKQMLATFLLHRKDIFATSISQLGASCRQKLVIDTGDNAPVRQRPYRVAPQVKAEIDKQVNEMLTHGIIRESYSNYASPVVMVKKKNGEYRFAIDYRKLNAITKTMNYPLPTFQDVTDLLGQATLFSVMDMKSGFWQLEIEESSKEKTAFICHSGLYEFNRVPFGLKNSPIIFQQVVEQALRGMNYYNALVYVDDIISFSQCFESHLENLKAIFEHLDNAGLKLHPAKCSFCVKEVTYLGHKISKHGVLPDPKKIEVVKEYPCPSSVKEVRAFLGLANYYRKFVQNYSTIASPLTSLLAKDKPFSWTEDCQLAFDKLKETLTSPPILVYPDFNKQFILSTDASGTRYQLHPVTSRQG